MPAASAPHTVLRAEPAQPWPLGAHWRGERLQFAVWAPDATDLQVCLFDTAGLRAWLTLVLPVCTDGVWHGAIDLPTLQAQARAAGVWLGEGVQSGSADARPAVVYGLRANGPWAPAHGHRFNPAKLLLDPCAREIVGAYAGDLSLYLGHDPVQPDQPDGRDNAAVAIKARVRPPRRQPLRAPHMDEEESTPWRVPPEQTVLYEVHVKGATQQHPGVPEALRGSYSGLAAPAMLAHLKALGVTTLNLLPVHARADEARLQQLGLTNYWGYSSIGYFAPEPRYASGQGGVNGRDLPVGDEFRAMVDTLHGAGLEVVLDVVYNHSAETDEFGPTLSFRGLGNARYYHLEPPSDPAHGLQPRRYRNWSGCGNCLNLAEPRVVQLVIDSLRHWVLEYAVDGFRFDLAPILARGRDGAFSQAAGFFAALQSDPVLAGVKLIAEPWDIGPSGYQVGGFPPGWQEWNDQFRDTLRGWWLRGDHGEGGDRGVFAHRFAGSSTQFHHDARSPLAGVNFITAHDGFSLRDLVSYDHKHNHANGEHNCDGHHHNLSWNGGVEGPTERADVLALRAGLQRALLTTLMLSQGTPMLLAGDEIGHSQQGNNNAYCQDNPLTWLDWPHADTALLRFVQRLIALRREQPSLRIPRWLTGRPDSHGRVDVRWLHPEGHALTGAEWADGHDRALAIALQDTATPDAAPALLLVNPSAQARTFALPEANWQAQLCSASPDGAPDATQQARPDALAPSLWTCGVPARAVTVLLGA